MRPTLTYANVMATIAVFIALGSGSFAVAALSGSEKNVVRKLVKKEAEKRITARAPGLSVDHAKTAGGASPTGPAGGDMTGTYPNPIIGSGKVTSAMLGDGAATTAKIADGAVTAGKLAITQHDNEVTIASNTTEFLRVPCEPGEKLVGGGAAWIFAINAAQAANMHLVESGPTIFEGLESWEAQGYNASGESRIMRVTVFCVKAP